MSWFDIWLALLTAAGVAIVVLGVANRALDELLKSYEENFHENEK